MSWPIRSATSMGPGTPPSTLVDPHAAGMNPSIIGRLPRKVPASENGFDCGAATLGTEALVAALAERGFEMAHTTLTGHNRKRFRTPACTLDPIPNPAAFCAALSSFVTSFVSLQPVTNP